MSTERSSRDLMAPGLQELSGKLNRNSCLLLLLWPFCLIFSSLSVDWFSVLFCLCG